MEIRKTLQGYLQGFDCGKPMEMKAKEMTKKESKN